MNVQGLYLLPTGYGTSSYVPPSSGVITITFNPNLLSCSTPREIGHFCNSLGWLHEVNANVPKKGIRTFYTSPQPWQRHLHGFLLFKSYTYKEACRILARLLNERHVHMDIGE